MNYYEEIKNKIIDNETYEKVKDYSKERYRVITYYEIGELLNEAGKKYGANIIKQYSKKLVIEVGIKYNERTLRRMRQLYLLFKKQKWSTVSTKLSWSHYSELLSIKNDDKLSYYLNLSIIQNIGVRELRKKIKSKEYERLPDETKNKIIKEEKLEVKDLVLNPILIKNKNNIEIITEKVLHNLILEDISSFMKELGNGYSFIDDEYKIKIGDTYHKIDLLLFNIKYNAYVVVELKVSEFKVEYISFVIEYCSDERIVVRKYVLV